MANVREREKDLDSGTFAGLLLQSGAILLIL